MLVVTKVLTCDGCTQVIEGDGRRPRNDHAVLSVGQTPTEPSDIKWGLGQSPMLERDFHFHNMTCLQLWMEGKGNHK